MIRAPTRRLGIRDPSGPDTGSEDTRHKLYLPTHTNRYVMVEPWGLPPRDEEFRLALRLLEQAPPLDREIVERLVGQPGRYRDLKPLLVGRNDNVLSKALARLRNEGILKQGLDVRSGEKRYSLTELGKLVVFRLHEMVPHHESIQAYERGVKASA